MQKSLYTISRVSLSSLLLLVLFLSIASVAGAAPDGGSRHLKAISMSRHGSHVTRWGRKLPPTYDECVQQLNIRCYSPQQMRNAYSITPLINAGYIGTGQTIVIIDSFGSPTAAADLARFDADYGLPDPPSFRVLAPLGAVPFDANNPDQVGWAQETNLDIQWAHAMAPGAGIVVLTSPVAETQGVQGMPEFLQLERYALQHRLGNIFSQSWGTTEETLFTPEGKKILDDFNALYRLASARDGVTFLASAGDSGSLNPDVHNRNYPFPTVGFPASSPWVTTVGGTSLYADRNGAYQAETVWNAGIGSATGGGYSLYFRAPPYQLKTLPQDIQIASRGYRGLPDVAYAADPATGVPVYLGFLPHPDYYLFGGTSAGTPQWAGLIADADQYAGHLLGFLNDKIYRLAAHQNARTPIFRDITVGNNAQDSIPGFQAGPGWDAVTGWGSPIADSLIARLAR